MGFFGLSDVITIVTVTIVTITIVTVTIYGTINLNSAIVRLTTNNVFRAAFHNLFIYFVSVNIDSFVGLSSCFYGTVGLSTETLIGNIQGQIKPT
jgi:hypothetical protein